MKLSYTCILVAAACMTLGGVSRGDEAAAAAFDKVKPLWEGQKAEAVNGIVEGRIYRYFDSRGGISRERINALIDGLAGRTDHARLDAALDGEAVEPWDKSKAEQWGRRFRVVSDGIKIRNSFEQKKGEDVYVFNGTSEADLQAFNHQVSVYAHPSMLSKMDLSTVRILPTLNRDAISRSGKVRTAANGLLELTDGGPTERIPLANAFTYHPGTGFVSRHTMADAQGRVVREVRAFDPEMHGGSIPFPALLTEVSYNKEGKVVLFSAYAFDKIEVNREIDEAEFALRIPSGTKVFDYRENEKAPFAFVTPTVVPDAAAYATLAKAKQVETQKSSYPSRLRGWPAGPLIAINVACLLVAAVVFVWWRRARSHPQG